MKLGAMLAAMLLVSIAFAVVVGAESAVGNAKNSREINTDEYNVGDVVAEGIHVTENTCDLGTLSVHTKAPGNGKTQWVAIKVNPKCQVVVNAKWHGSLKDGPQDVTKPILSVMSNETSSISESPQLGLMSSNVPVLAATASSKTSEQHIYMYGFGGPIDKLTHKYGKLTFSYDGQSATISSQSGSCSGSKPFWWYEWKVDSCTTNSVNNGPAYMVYRIGQGSYHCDPANTSPCSLSDPDGYYHSLTDQETGYADGTSRCTYTRSGNIVFGTGEEFLQGCS